MSPDTPAATPSPCDSCARLDRRQFLTSASVLSLGALATSACGDGVFSGPESIPAFPSASFSFDPRTVSALQTVGGRAVIQQGTLSPVLVERTGPAQYRALALACPHRGTIVNVEDNGFLCPNHGARFADDGTWLSGQPTADLAPVGVRVDPDGTLAIGGTPPPPALSLAATSMTFVMTTTGANPVVQTVTIGNVGGGTLSGLQVSLAYAPNQRSGWLTVQLDRATAPALLTLGVQKGTLAAGTYNATVTVSAPGVSSGAQTLAVAFVIQDPASPPSLLLSSSAVAFSTAAGSSPAAQVVQCTNAGGGALSGLAVQVAFGAGATGWLSATLNTTTAPASLTLRATVGMLAPGTYGATVTVAATGVVPRTLPVSLTVSPVGLVVNIAAWPALANVGGVAGSVGNVNGGPVAVVRTSATSFSAFSMVCPHAGTTINVVSGASFRCPNHGALFNSAGENLPNSPQRTSNLSRLTVSFTPGAATLVVS